MAKGPGVSATSHIIATSQTNVHNYIENRGQMQEKNHERHKTSISSYYNATCMQKPPDRMVRGFYVYEIT